MVGTFRVERGVLRETSIAIRGSSDGVEIRVKVIAVHAQGGYICGAGEYIQSKFTWVVIKVFVDGGDSSVVDLSPVPPFYRSYRVKGFVACIVIVEIALSDDGS